MIPDQELDKAAEVDDLTSNYFQAANGALDWIDINQQRNSFKEVALFISWTVSGDVPIARNHCMTPNCLSILKVLKKNTPQKLTKAKDAFISLYKHVKKNPGGYTPFTIDW